MRDRPELRGTDRSDHSPEVNGGLFRILIHPTETPMVEPAVLTILIPLMSSKNFLVFGDLGEVELREKAKTYIMR